MAFINTMDVLGDEATLAKILEGTITEYNDESCTIIQGRRFYGCSALVSVDLPNVSMVRDYAFQECKSLITANLPEVTKVSSDAFNNTAITQFDLPKLTSVDARAFYNCPKLTAFIIRNTESVIPMGNASALQSGPIAWGTGYIYVPSALYDQYIVATNWSTFSAQFRKLEDYTVDGTITGDLDESKI